jgi:PAS domain S-box-containing protein
MLPISDDDAFRLLFENSADAIWLYDVLTGTFVDCNDAAVAMMGAGDKSQLLRLRPADLAPERQSDGRTSAECAAEITSGVRARGSARFEWLGRRLNGELISVEIVTTAVQYQGRELHFVVCRDISKQREALQTVRELNLTLERRVAERTVELVRINDQLKSEIEERGRRERVQRATYEISEAAHQADDLDHLYASIHATIGELMPARNFYIALYNPKTQFLEFPYFEDERDPKPAPFKLETGLTGSVIRSGRTVLARHSEAKRRQVGEGVVLEGLVETPYRETGSPAAVWLGAPMKVRDRTVGVMAVQDYENEAAYGDEEEQILTYVAEQTAWAIERKRAAQLLRESEERHRALYETTSEAVVLHDETGVVGANPMWFRMFGYANLAQVLGKQPWDFAPPLQPSGEPSEKAARQHMDQALTNGSARFEWLALRQDGSPFPLEVLLTPIRLGPRTLIQAVVTDITDRKQAEADLLRSLAKEKELGRLRSNFVSMVSHEFRTPLGIIISSAGLLESYFDRLDPATRAEHLQTISRNIRRMASLMEDVLLFGQVEAGKLSFEPAALNVRRFCYRLIEEVQPATPHACPLQLEFADEVPETVAADERLLRHAFFNLLTNAVKYSQPGSPVHFTVRPVGQELVWTVRDSGIGIPPEDLGQLFQAFQRGRNVGQVPGTGLGLVLVKRCVELHGGLIAVDSTVGTGTTITVRLPFSPA